MNFDQRTLAAALFDIFADIIESETNEGNEFKKGSIKAKTSWKVNGVALAGSFFAHGVWRFGGLHFNLEPNALSLLRDVSRELFTSETPFEEILAHQLCVHISNHLSPGSEIAIGLSDDDTEYSGNLILIQLRDLACATLSDTGAMMVHIDGAKHAFNFKFRKQTPAELVNAKLGIAPLIPTPQPAGL